MAAFDVNAMEMVTNGPQEDLVNAAALETIAYGGEIFVLEPDQVPGESQMAAVLRF